MFLTIPLPLDKRIASRQPRNIPFHIPKGPRRSSRADIGASRQKQGYRQQAEKQKGRSAGCLPVPAHRRHPSQRIEKPLSSLLVEITIPPSLAGIILDTNVGEPWIDAIMDFERRLNTSKARTRVKAARDLGEVAEGLRIVVSKLLS